MFGFTNGAKEEKPYGWLSNKSFGSDATNVQGVP
jgi:hypothetical protein